MTQKIVDALLAVEWVNCRESNEHCSFCICLRPKDPSRLRPYDLEHPEYFMHHKECVVDAVLTESGYADQESRNAARSLLKRTSGYIDE
jgi:hypothetical protein